MRRPGRTAMALALSPTLVAASAGASYALWSTQAQATLTVTTSRPLPAPTGFHCTEIRNNDVSLAWSAVPGASGYVVLRRIGTGPAFTYSQPLSTTGTSIGRVHRSTWGITPNSSATLVVRAVGSAESPDSDPVSMSFGHGGSCTPGAAP